MVKRIIKSIKFRMKYILYVQHILEIVKTNAHKKKCLLLGSPHHVNAGDNAQTLCIEEWIANNLPEYLCIEFLDEYTERFGCYLLKLIKNYIHDDDIIILHSGYHTTDLYPVVEHIQSASIKLFPNNKIVFFPQTVNFRDISYQNEVSNLYNSHNDAVMLCRDYVSFDISKQIFKNIRLYLYPDIVTSLIGKYRFFNKREGVYLCLRTGLESKISAKERNDLELYLKEKYQYTCGDTDLHQDVDYFVANRKIVIEKYIEDLSKYKLVITDRYHGMIFSLVANTPVIVIPSADHKLESGVKWFDGIEGISDYVFFEGNARALPNLIDKVMNNDYSYRLPSYFKEVYYDKLKEKLFTKS